MAQWELIVEAMKQEHESGRGWLRRGEIVHAVQATAPGTNTASMSANVSAYCINDPSKKHYPGLLYRKTPLLITDDPTLRGKRYRLLTQEERTAFLRSPRDDLDQFSYLQVVEWLHDPAIALEAEAEGADEVSSAEAANEIDIAGPMLFELHLQDYLFRNWRQVFPHLQLYNGTEGREFITRDPSVGIIDFLCTDSSGNFVVIETKRKLTDRQAVGQILGYMGWVTRRLADGDPSRVTGMLIVGEASDSLRMAATAVPNLDLWVYEVSFSLRQDGANP